MRRFLPALLCSVLMLSAARAADDYKLGPDSEPQPDAPKGSVKKYSWTSKIFPGTVRDYWIYEPLQYDPARPACIMIFQDGKGRADEWRVPVVFDNLINSKEMPVTIGVFISPGVIPATSTNALPRYNRSYEYDGLGDQYARFLLEEILPEVSKNYNITTNATGRAIAGASSGGIAAWTVAWERPDQFSKVFSTIGTYVGLRGGNDYPVLIRKTEPKPIRVFLQDGSNDLNIYGGSWYIANLDMLSALQFAGYDVNHAWGDGGHTGKHGAAIFPDAIRWLWRDYPSEIKVGTESKQPLMSILEPGKGWEEVSSGHKFTEGPAVNAAGEIFFTDMSSNTIHKIDRDGKVSVFASDTGRAIGLMFGADGRLYACAHALKKIVAYTQDGKATTIVEDVTSNDLAVSAQGIYFTDPEGHKVWFIDKSGNKRVVDEGLRRPNGIVLTPDQSLLLVSDTEWQFVFSYQVQADGSLAYKQRYFHLHLQDGNPLSGADGMTMDALGNLYVTTEAGLQVCDQAGRVTGIINKPQRAWLSNVVFGGPELDTLYVTCGDKVYKRATKVKGVLSWRDAIKPPAPRL